MSARFSTTVVCALAACSTAMAGQGVGWWNPRWRLRTTVFRPTPYRDSAPRPVEVAVDFPLVLARAGVPGEFAPGSIRVIERGVKGPEAEVPCAYRTEFDVREGRERAYVTWTARPRIGGGGVYDIYFDTKDRGIEPAEYDAEALPRENLLVNPGFEDEAGGLPAGWTAPAALVRLERFPGTTGRRSLKIVVDENTPADAPREIAITQKIDVRRFAGQEMVFECDLLPERAAYGAPVSVELRQFRSDGSRIQEYAVQPRWLSVEMAAGQTVQFSERGRFSPDAATLEVAIRLRCYVNDEDTAQVVTGPESFFTVWLDRVVVRAGERWPWPAATNAGFVEGALPNAPFNRGFAFTGQRRLAFNGASEGSLTDFRYNPDPQSVHWGVETGTLEFWCRPSWNADDGVERTFFKGYGYLYRLQSLLRKLNVHGKNQLEFLIADADRNKHIVRGPAPLRAGQWHHVAATWDFPNAHLQLFVDGKRVGSEGPGRKPWPSSRTALGNKKVKGIGISDKDTRSIPMQAFIGGTMASKNWPETGAAEAVLDEFRISDAVRYTGDFAPSQEEFAADDHTRALWHFENERHGVHGGDDQFVRSYLGCELPLQEEKAPLDVLADGKIERRMALVKPYASDELFEANRGENRLGDLRPFRELPDPRFIEYRERRVERTVDGVDDAFTLTVGGDLEPLMRSATFQYADQAAAKTTLLPRWRANDNVVPFSAESIKTTLAPDAAGEPEKAFETFKYMLQTTSYYDAHYCETLPCGRHRPRVSYTFLKALNIYPYDQCGPLNHTLRKLFLAAGISSSNAPGTHHQFQQAFYQGSLRLFDLASRMYWLNRDNKTVCSLRMVGEDPQCKLRQSSRLNSYYPGRPSRATFGVAVRPHNMDFPLRAGERASVCWHNEGRWFEVTGERQPISLAKVPPLFGNGVIVYEPGPLSALSEDATVLDNMLLQAQADASSVLRARDPEKPAALIYRAGCPYIFSDGLVTGAYAAGEAGAIVLSLSFDQGKNWTEVWRSPGKAGEVRTNIRKHVTGRYAYWLKLELAAAREATLSGLKVRTVFVASALSLPGKLSLGENRIRFVGGPPAVPIKTTCSWVERHKTDLGVSLNAISYYNLDHQRHRNLFVVAPGGQVPVKVVLQGRRLRGTVSLEGLPHGTGSFSRREKVPVPLFAEPARQEVDATDPARPASVDFILHAAKADPGRIHGLDVVVRAGDIERHVPVEVLVANAALLREAEHADELSGDVAPMDMAELSGARGVAFKGKGEVAFDFSAPAAGRYALWLHARWDLGRSTAMTLKLDQATARRLRAHRAIGFRDWTDSTRAFTKGFVAYPKAYEHWAWYRIRDVEVAAGKHRLTLGADAGAHFDALILLPQNDVMDRAGMNLFLNWNYAPQYNPL